MTADIVFLNGEIITVNHTNSIEEALAIAGNQIVAVGSNEEVKKYIDSNSEVIDLNGKTVLPGFIDSHLHILYGTSKLGIDCKQQNIQSITELLQALKNKKLSTPKGQWIRVTGFNETTMQEKRYPTLEELNEISSDHPIYISRTCNHISVVNEKALEITNLLENSFQHTDKHIERNNEGKLTGRLLESANMQMLELANFSEDELQHAFKLASEDFLANGITSIHDAGGHGPQHFRTLFKSVQSGEVRVRVYAMLCSLNNSENFVKNAINAGIVTGMGNDRFRIGPAKIFTDGSSSGPTIATRKPYTSNKNDCGILYYSQEEIDEIFMKAHQDGFQITAHAQGDLAIEMVLNSIEYAQTRYPRKDCRHRIEHAGIAEPDLQKRMKQLQVIPIPNPTFFYEFGEGYITNYGERVNHMYPLRDFLHQDIIVAAGSDCPVTSCNPLLGIHVALNRKSKNGTIIGENQTIGLLEAIRLFTWNGAYASFEETIKGSLEVGKLADIVVLDKSILKTGKESIKDITVMMTLVDGKVEFHKNTATEVTHKSYN